MTKLKNEYTFCSNYFYLFDHIESINPNYYCICDSATFSDDRIEKVHDIFNQCDSETFILNKNALDKLSEEEKRKSFFVCGMHMPSLFKIRNNLAGVSSSFTNVSMFCILCASYMGFENIYILGNDFAPGAGLTHCYGNLELEKETNEVYRKKNRVNLCTFYWSYYLAHAQSFYTKKFVQKQHVNIFNVNPESYVKAYDFADYDSLFKTDDIKHLNYSLKEQIYDFVPTFIISILMYIIVFVLLYVLKNVNIYIVSLAGVITGVTVYVGLCRLLKIKEMKEAISFIKQYFKR